MGFCGKNFSLEQLRAAADCAIAGGADFLQTTTGKAGAEATLVTARCLGEAIRATARPLGLKVAGGVHSLMDASRYLAIAAEIYGRERVVPARFRIGSSVLLDELLPALALEPVDEG